MPYHSHDTIAAIATPVGVGGISVIRISGESSFSAADSFFKGSMAVNDAESHTIHYGTIMDPVSRETVDSVLISVFRNPHSFTGENVVEISSHGGYFVAKRILQLLYSSGVRPAEPGEFTLRAFLNGKMDLAQAEAVADLIHAKTEKSHKASIEQLKGKLSDIVKNLRLEILNICSLLELELDFSQEGLEIADKTLVLQKLDAIEKRINELSLSYQEGKFIKEGIKVSLIGKPNAGKSSLLNVLLREDRAIVSEIPGTTRDTIEESIILDGVEFIFFDTAGLRESNDEVELEGIKRTSKAIESSNVVILLVDGSKTIPEEEKAFYQEFLVQHQKTKPVLLILNKSDIKKDNDLHTLGFSPLWISCKNYEGINELKRNLVDISIPHHDSISSSVTITTGRHRDALEQAKTSIQSAKKSITEGMSGDFAALDLRAALNYLGEIIGLTTPDDILNNIFSNFCIGK